MKKGVCFFSSIGRLSQAKVSIESFFEYNQNIDCLFLLCDPPEMKSKLDFPDYVKVITFPECSSLHQEIIQKYGYLGGLIRVMIIEYALKQGYDKILCLDGDMETFSSVEEVFDWLDEYNAVVTPHLLNPVPNDDNLNPRMDDFVFSGNYNSAFFACRNNEEVRKFVSWWMDVSFKFGNVDRVLGRSGEQGWLRFIADYMDHVLILRDPAYNVAYWNVFQRDFSFQEGQWLVKGKPLRIFHYSGLDMDHPERISVYQNRYEAKGFLLDFLKRYVHRCRNKS
jgi:hypothetical protein